ncbi:MAG: hypothetical protein EXS63_08205, partial [Candidatus Omnitrophica bacterium]|nr:hypothetical protein [Candidatus Omnitrophota bacterium]
MKNLMMTRMNKAVSLVVLFSILFTQVVPAGLAAELSRELRPEDLTSAQAAMAVKNVPAPELLSPDQIPSGTWVPAGPLSPATVDPIVPQGVELMDPDFIRQPNKPGSPKPGDWIIIDDPIKTDDLVNKTQPVPNEGVVEPYPPMPKIIDPEFGIIPVAPDIQDHIQPVDGSKAPVSPTLGDTKDVTDIVKAVAKARSQILENVHDSQGRVTWTIQYDKNGNVISIRHLIYGADGELASIESYASDGSKWYLKQTQIRENGKITKTIQYDANGRMISEQRADGSRLEYLYQGKDPKTVSGIVVVRPDGKRVTVDFNGQTGVDAYAVEAAVIDLLNQKDSGVQSGEKLMVKDFKRDWDKFWCTESIPPSCGGGYSFKLELPSVSFSYEVSFHERVLQKNYNAKLISKQPLVKEDPAVTQAREAVTQTLMDTFGWSKEQIADWLKRGLLKMDFDPKTLKMKVTFDDSIKPKTNLFDPIGGGAMPKEIEFQLERWSGDVGYEQNQNLIRFLPLRVVSASFKIGDLRYEIVFERYTSFVRELIDPLLVENGILKYKISPWFVTVYDSAGKVLRTIDWTRDGAGNLHATINYLDGSQGPVASRDVTLSKLADGQYHIQTVVDKDKDGNLLAVSTFEYTYLKLGALVRGPGFPSWWNNPILWRVIRTDKTGAVISEITSIGDGTAKIKV